MSVEFIILFRLGSLKNINTHCIISIYRYSKELRWFSTTKGWSGHVGTANDCQRKLNSKRQVYYSPSHNQNDSLIWGKEKERKKWDTVGGMQRRMQTDLEKCFFFFISVLLFHMFFYFVHRFACALCKLVGRKGDGKNAISVRLQLHRNTKTYDYKPVWL